MGKPDCLWSVDVMFWNALHSTKLHPARTYTYVKLSVNSDNQETFVTFVTDI